MKRNAAEILREATALSAEDRAALAESWLAGLDGHVDDDAATAWATEIDRRVVEVDAGTVATIPWLEVRRRRFERARRRALNRRATASISSGCRQAPEKICGSCALRPSCWRSRYPFGITSE